VTIWQIGDPALICGVFHQTLETYQQLSATPGRKWCSLPPYNVPISAQVGACGSIQPRDVRHCILEMSQADLHSFLQSVIRPSRNVFRQWDAIHFSAWTGVHIPECGLRYCRLPDLKNSASGPKQWRHGSLYRSQARLVFVFKSVTCAAHNNVEMGNHGLYPPNVWNYAGKYKQLCCDRADLSLHPT